MIFLDYDVRLFQPRNGATQSYVLPYAAYVTVGDFRPDDSKGGSVYIQHNRRVQSSGNVRQMILNANFDNGLGSNDLDGDSPVCGGVVALKGDTIIVQALDDMDVRVYIFRLPEEDA